MKNDKFKITIGERDYQKLIKDYDNHLTEEEIKDLIIMKFRTRGISIQSYLPAYIKTEE